MIAVFLITALFLALYVKLILSFYSAWNHLPETKLNVIDGVFISVIIPFHNEERSLESLINDLKSQDYPSDNYEVILVDDFSTDDSYAKAEKFGKNISNIRLLKNNLTKGKKFALKAGIDIAKAEYILISDADCSLPITWISCFARYFSTYPNKVLVSSAVTLKENNSFSGKFQLLEFSSLVASGAASFMQGAPIMCNAANLGFRKQIFLEGFEEFHPEINTGDDMFLMLFAKKFYPEELGFLKHPDAFNKTFPAEGWMSLVKQRIRWASKSAYYRDRQLIYVSIVVFMMNTFILAFFILSFFSLKWMVFFLVTLFIKSIPDFLFLRSFLNYTGQHRHINFFIPSQIIYSIFIPLTAIMGFLVRFKTGEE